MICQILSGIFDLFSADPHLHRRALPGQFGETSDEKPGRGVAMGLRHDRMWKSGRALASTLLLQLL